MTTLVPFGFDNRPRSKKKHLESVMMNGRIPFQSRDPAGSSNLELHHTRSFRLKKILGGNSESILAKLGDLGFYESSPVSTSLLMVAPYEVELMKDACGKTIHVDATY